ncbi:MAG TPA: amidohydrolase family protein [Kofleriaceae bacterium]|nr:amidohydrolase family protein [Kofleriaceae bacterium]
MRWVAVVCAVASCVPPETPAVAPTPPPAPPPRPAPPLLVTAPQGKLQPFVAVDAPVVVLQHVHVIDGTGTPGRDDQTIVIENGRISAIGTSLPTPADAKILDMTGHTAVPGIVDMHGHLYYGQLTTPPAESIEFAEQPVSFPRLYLAAGVTTIRTAGSLEPYADLAVKRNVDAGIVPGPHFALTAPYLSGPGEPLMQMVQLATPEDTKRFVDFWLDAGFTSLKAYMHLPRASLRAAIDEAHARGVKITGHLCAVTYTEAAELGIDNLEHGLAADTDLVDGKKPDDCPQDMSALAKADIDGPKVRAIIDSLVKHHVAVTSTLAIFEPFMRAATVPLDERAMAVLNPTTRDHVVKMHAMIGMKPPPVDALAKEFAFERAFVKAGGTLLAGSDPTGYGAAVAGFADQRELELLVEAGFTAPQAIQIASANGAAFLGVADQIGTLAPGKRADLVIVKGNPEQQIKDVEQVEVVFKDGVGYDPQKLIGSVTGTVGLH